MTDSQRVLLDLNEGSRPSQLQLDMEALGEREVSEGGDDARRLHREALDAARRDVVPFDVAALRARAKPAEVVSLASWRRRLGLAGGAAAMAAAALVMVNIGRPGPQVRAKGGPQVGWMALQNGDVRLGNDDLVVHPGDRLQFTWAGDAEDMVLMGADGSGELRVLWPSDAASGPVTLEGESGLLEGSVELDDAPGPELFFAVFNPDTVDSAVQQVSDALAEEASAEALVEWGDEHWDVDVILVTKAPSH